MRVYRPGTIRALAATWLLGLAAFGGGGPAAPPEGFPDVVARVRQAVGAVGTYNPHERPPVVFSASGFFVDPRGYFLTANHALQDIAKRLRLTDLRVFLPGDVDRRGLVATVVAEEPKYDLAVLKVEGAGFHALKLGDSTRAREGQAIGLCGFPFGVLRGLHPATNAGIISSVSPIATPVLHTKQLTPELIEALRSPFSVFQLDATAYPGHSGGPLFDARTGEVLGVVNSAFIRETKEQVIASGISYAIPIHLARPWLENALKADSPEGKPKEPQGAKP